MILPRIQMHICFRNALRSIPICIMWGDSTLAPGHVALWWRAKVACEWLPGTFRLSYTVMPVTFIAAGGPCSGTLSEPRPWAWLSWFAQRLRTCRCVLSSPCVLHCPAFLHRGYLALLGELFLRYPLEWQSMGIADCLFGCHCNSPALFLL